VSVFSSLRSSLSLLSRSSPLPDQDDPDLWRPTARTHLLHLGVAVFLIVLSPYLGTPLETTAIVLTVVASLALPLTSVIFGLGAGASFVVMWVASAVPQTTGVIPSMAVWGAAAMLLARGLSRQLVYGYIAAAVAVIVYYDTRQEVFGASLVWIAIIGVPCVIFGELLRHQRKRAIDVSRQRRKLLARQRRLLTSELHDTVANDLAYAVMAAERLKIARPDDSDLARELNGVIEPVRTAAAQLRRSLRSMNATDNDAALALLSVVPPRPVIQVLDDTRRVLAGRQASLEAEGVDLFDEDGVFTPGTRQQVVRVIGELVSNAAKYTSVNGCARVVAEVNGDVLECMVTNSVDANRSKDKALSSGVGLEGARLRVEALGGEFVTNRGGGRWTVVFNVPLRATQ